MIIYTVNTVLKEYLYITSQPYRWCNG